MTKPNKSQSVAKNAKDGDIFTPKFKTWEAMDKELDIISKAESTVREGLHHVLVSAFAHHEACLDKGGSIQTVLTKVHNRIMNFKSVNQRMIWNYYKAILGPNVTYQEGKKGAPGVVTARKGKSLVFNTTIKQEAGEVLFYELPFWRLDANQVELKPWSFIERVRSLIAMADEPEKLEKLGKPGKDAFTSQQERDTVIAFKRVFALVQPDPNKAEIDSDMVKDITALAIKAKDNPEVIHKAA